MTRILLAMLEFYRRWLSPAVHALGGGGGCRFVPTCSEYASIAVATHGPLRGTGLAVWRLSRCHPFCRGGLDPVPIAAKSKDRDVGAPGSNARASAHLPHEPLT
jgi:uncharacterized protein